MCYLLSWLAALVTVASVSTQTSSYYGLDCVFSANNQLFMRIVAIWSCMRHHFLQTPVSRCVTLPVY